VKTFRLKLKLKGGFATPFDADTIFGGLCWTIRYFDGEDALTAFLDRYHRGQPPLILSNAFPGDLFPKPLIPRTVPKSQSRSELISSAREAKRVKNINYLTPDEFFSLAKGHNVFLSGKEKAIHEEVTLHNQINRCNNSTAESGQLFESNEFHLSPEHDFLSIYIKTEENFAEYVFRLFEKLGQSGLGKRKSSGMGAFSLLEFQEYDKFIVDNPNAFITLSNFVPFSKDPTVGFYISTIKYGKLGEQYALSEYPFKRPLFMIKAGSVFLTDNVLPYYGRLVKNVSLAKPEVVQYGLAFSVPARVPREGF
jgi:CRISPR-associated protein Csm4